jgi:hypothetical protein
MKLSVLNGITEFPAVGNFDEELKQFILSMVNPKPSERPFVPQIIEKINELIK